MSGTAVRGGESMAVAGIHTGLQDAVPAADTGQQPSVAGDYRRTSDAPRDHTAHSRPWGKGCYVHLRAFERDSGPLPVHAEQRQR